MHLCVAIKIRDFLGEKSHEGTVKHMYLDRKYLVTIGVGQLIDPIQTYISSLNPQWFNDKNDRSKKITKEDIKKDFNVVKKARHLVKVDKKGKPIGTDYKGFAMITQLRITDPGLNQYFATKLKRYENGLKKKYSKWFGDFDKWPADAQLGLLSMAWALGSGGVAGFKNFREYCRKKDFLLAAEQCHYIKKGLRESASSKDRNEFNKILFRNASYVLYKNLSIAKLVYPQRKNAPKGWKPSEIGHSKTK